MQEARAVDQVVPVDIYLPGCPPSADAIWYVLSELLAGRHARSCRASIWTGIEV